MGEVKWDFVIDSDCQLTPRYWAEIYRIGPDVQGQRVAQTAKHLHEWRAEQSGNLIAATPDLLEACKELVREIKRCDAEAEQNAPPNHFNELDYSLIQLAQQAIAKAEGEER